MKTNELNIGDFAVCQKGELGLILWKTPSKIKRTNKSCILYHGLNLTEGKIGKNWQSQYPKKVTKNYVKKQFNDQKIKNKNLATFKKRLSSVVKEEFIEDWLQTANKAFSGKKPIDLVNEGNFDLLFEMLFRLESGIPN